MQNFRENSLLFQEHLIVCSVDQECRVKFLVPFDIKILITNLFFMYREISGSWISSHSHSDVENRVLEYWPIRLVPWNFGTRIPSETVLTVEKTIFRKTRKKDTILLAARSYTVRHYLQQIWKYKEISGSLHAAFQWHPDIGFSMPRVKYELERIQFLTLGGHVACLGTRYVRVCPYSRRIRVRIVWFQLRDTPYFTQC